MNRARHYRRPLSALILSAVLLTGAGVWQGAQSALSAPAHSAPLLAGGGNPLPPGGSAPIG